MVLGSSPLGGFESPFSVPGKQIGGRSEVAQCGSSGLASVENGLLVSLAGSSFESMELPRSSSPVKQLVVDESTPHSDLPPTRSWASIVSGSSKQQPTMSLRLIEPSMDAGKIVVSPPIIVLEQGAKRWECCLVGFILDNRLPSLVVRSIALKM